MSLFYLDWQRDRDGYRIEEPIPAPPGRSSILVSGSESMIVRNGGKLLGTEPLNYPGMWREFAACKTPDDALAFVAKYGFLSRADTDAEPVGQILDHAKSVHVLQRESEFLAPLDAWDVMARWLQKYRLGRCSVVIRPPRKQGEGPQIQARPDSLLHAIYTQALQAITGGTHYEPCQNSLCRNWFVIGPNGKRPEAKYCSPTCQKQHAYLKTRETQR